MNLKCPSKNVHHLFLGLEPLTKMVHIFLRQHWVTELNHTLFAFGHLNFIHYFKCPNIHELKCLLLEIFQTVALSSFMNFEFVLVLLINP